MNTALDNFVQKERSGQAVAPSRKDDVEKLVAVRADILHDAEHAIGNLFQRLYHVSRAAREALGSSAERFTANLEDLERLLELVFDYVTPTELNLQPLASERLTESLVAHLRPLTGSDIRIDSAQPARLLVDVRIIGRALSMLARAVVRRAAEAAPIDIVERSDAADRYQVGLSTIAAGSAFSADVRVALGVASRLIELHGGEFVAKSDGDRFTVVFSLPASSQGERT